MTDKRAQAISVANHYFILADGMVSDLENYFADDVIFIWFGRKIMGKKNVVDFLLSNEIKSFHSFPNIMPISGIAWDEQPNEEEEEQSSDQSNDSPEVKLETHTSNCSGEALAGYLHETEMSMTCENAIDSKQESDKRNTSIEKNYDTDRFDIETYINELKIPSDMYYDYTDVDTNIKNQNQVSANAIAETDDQSYDLNEYDLRNLFEPEITSQAFVQNVHIHNINRIKLEEEMAPTIKAINRECSQGDGSEANTIKYLETNGEIKFVQKCASEDSFSCYHWSRMSKQKDWTRKCKLQIAYSLLTDNKLPTIVKKTTEKSCVTPKETHFVCEPNLYTAAHHSAHNTQENNRMPSLEEVMQIDTQSILNRDYYFNGYLRPINFVKDRENFLKSFEEEMKPRSSVQYVENKLVFNCPNKKSFKVIYQIHMIVYK
ncbi:uncharacterized protein [Linepithema humile]|uniref:uncharacterized protein n=1 Tax=Linepithema humile TaxID=83485 RepID=UPI00351E2943